MKFMLWHNKLRRLTLTSFFETQNVKNNNFVNFEKNNEKHYLIDKGLNA